LAGILKERDEAVEPLRKKQRLEWDNLVAPFNAKIADIREEIHRENQKRLYFIGRVDPREATRFDINLSNNVRILSCYATKEEASENLPADSKDHAYVIGACPINRIKEENMLESSPPSR